MTVICGTSTALQAEMERLRGELAKAVDERDEARRERDQARSFLANVLGEQDEMRAERDDALLEAASLAGLNVELEAERDRLRSALDTVWLFDTVIFGIVSCIEDWQRGDNTKADSTREVVKRIRARAGMETP